MKMGEILEGVVGGGGKELGVKFGSGILDGGSLDELDEWSEKGGVGGYCKS